MNKETFGLMIGTDIYIYIYIYIMYSEYMIVFLMLYTC